MMAPFKTGIVSGRLSFLAAAAGLLVYAPTVSAQPQTQILAVNFDTFAFAAPLSDWLTAGIAVLLAATAVVTLRRRNTRGGRLFGWMLALIAGTVFFAATGQRLVSDAQALLPLPAINLVVSPGTLDVVPYSPTDPLNVTVTNTTGKFARIISITLGSGPTAYDLDPSSLTTCVVNLTLPPNATCNISMFRG
jgi:hypothetical protein